MSTLNKKTILLVAGVAAVSSLATGAATYYLNNNSNLPGTSETPAGVAAPIQADATLPEGTISPSDFLNKIEEYNTKDSKPKIRGLLIGVKDNEYVLVDQQSKEGQSRAIKLDFSGTDIDPKSYLNAYTGTESAGPESTNKIAAPTGPVTVTIISLNETATSSFKVVSVER